MTNPAYCMSHEPPHTPSCHVPETAVSSSMLDHHFDDKLTVSPVTYT